MADRIRLTPTPVRTSTQGATQPLSEAIDVSRYDIIDFILGTISLGGTGRPTAALEIITGTQKETEDGWVRLVLGTTQNASLVLEKVRGEGPMQYIRWRVPVLTGTTPSVTFFIEGMGRKLG